MTNKLEINKNDIAQFGGIVGGSQRIIPDRTIVNFRVTGGFAGIREGKSSQEVKINLEIIDGEYKGQTYRINLDGYYSNDAAKYDKAIRNLGVVDAASGFKFVELDLDVTTDNIEMYWTGAKVRGEIGMFIDKDTGDQRNTVRGLGHYIPPKPQQQVEPQQAAPQEQPAPQQAEPAQQPAPQAQQQPAPQQQIQMQGDDTPF